MTIMVLGTLPGHLQLTPVSLVGWITLVKPFFYLNKEIHTHNKNMYNNSHQFCVNSHSFCVFSQFQVEVPDALGGLLADAGQLHELSH